MSKVCSALSSITSLDYVNDQLIGQTTQADGYYCPVGSINVRVQSSSMSHSARDYLSGCSRSLCNSRNTTYSCRLSSTPCFDYRTANNVSYCAPGILCSILEPCNNITGTCSQNNSIFVVNSCCQPKAVCLPSLYISLCQANLSKLTLEGRVVSSP